jgi:hypothetical protein
VKPVEILIGSLLALLVVECSADFSEEISDSSPALELAWAEWEKGNVDAAERLGQGLPASDESRHLLALAAFVKGEYEASLALYSEIDASYEWLEQLDDVVVIAHLHLAQADKAYRFAKARGMDATTLATLKLRVAHPLHVNLDGITVVPFAEHPLTPYFPGFRVELEGKLLTAHLDTGGTFLIMGPEVAQQLGIDLIDAGGGYQGSHPISLQMGVVKQFRLGDAVLKNVPVTVTRILEAPKDLVIFGTNVLQQFLATVDYPKERLILSPRDNSHLSERHRTMLEDGRVELPFYMGGDHYMFARGGFGDHKDLNFFIDSGLVSLAQGTGGLRQACFEATADQYKEWGVDTESTTKVHFETSLPISLGPLEQRDQFYVTVEKPIVDSLGGVRIDGLLAHAFLKEYAWTLDFESHRYLFSQSQSGSP